jgi:hypothetical protein
VQALLKGIADGGGKNMGNAENVMRVAGWYVVGEVIRELGANVSRRTKGTSVRSDKVDDVLYGRDHVGLGQGVEEHQSGTTPT